MEVSVSWLRALAPALEGSADDLAADLSSRAVPVDRVEVVGEGLDDVVVGRVVEVRRHPNADRLSLCLVDAGGDDRLEVVCGAPNVVEGALYPFVEVGGQLPGGLRIESRKIRGQTSHGMLCSEREIGLGRDAAGIMRLGDGHTPGTPLRDALDLPDARLDLDLTPNRIDLACHVGVVRELTAAGVGDVHLPDFGTSWRPEWVTGASRATAAGVSVAILDEERCSRYLAAIVRGVTIGPSPDWLQARLRSAGSQPINNVVDATNYVLLELNQPLHAFDLSRVGGSEIRVRAAVPGERLTTLDGTEHALGPEVTVIADAERAVALAGVMGGAESEVTLDTADLLIECAAFDPRHTRHTARAVDLATDASYRFERGIDESGLEAALRRCVELILATAGGEAEPQAIRVGQDPPERVRLLLRPARVRQVLGLRLSPAQIAGLLTPLGFEVESPQGAGDGIEVVVPGWRRDVRHEVDLIEEVARRYGYESFPHERRKIQPSAVPDSQTWRKVDRARQELRSLGLLEARSAGFTSSERAQEDAIRLLKPLSGAEAFLRDDLVPGLLDRVEYNWTRGRRDVRLFEIGTVFRRRAASRDANDASGTGTGMVEEMRAALAVTGRRHPPHWSREPDDLQIWDLRGYLEQLASALDLGVVTGGPPPAEPMARLPFGTGQWLADESACIFLGEELVGFGGAVSSDSIDSPPWAAPVFAAEFRLEAVRPVDHPRYVELPSFPAAMRDLAFVVRADAPAQGLAESIRAAAPGTLERLELFDVYEGEAAGEGHRSLAWRLVFRAPDRTLTDEEVEEGLASIVAKLKEDFDVRIRSA